MTYSQRETSREIRLWIRDIFVPAAVVVYTVASNPKAREFVADRYNKVKTYVNKFTK